MATEIRSRHSYIAVGIRRMQSIVRAWKVLDHADRTFVIRLLREEFPLEFWEALRSETTDGFHVIVDGKHYTDFRVRVLHERP